MYKLIQLLLTLVTVGLEAWAAKEIYEKDQGWKETEEYIMWRKIHLFQMVLLNVMNFLLMKRIGNTEEKELNGSVKKEGWHRIALLILLGTLFSLCGDLINSGVIDLTHIRNPQTLLSIPPFAIAHILYCVAFAKAAPITPLGDEKAGEAKSHKGNGVLRRTIFVVGVPLLAFGGHSAVVDSRLKPFMQRLSLGYGHVLAAMVVLSTWPLGTHGRAALPPFLGACIFYFSDMIFGYTLADGVNRWVGFSHAIWLTYFLGQMLISRLPLLAFHNSNMMKKNKRN